MLVVDVHDLAVFFLGPWYPRAQALEGTAGVDGHGSMGVGGISSPVVCTGGSGRAGGWELWPFWPPQLDGDFIFSRLLQRKETAGSWKLVESLSACHPPTQEEGTVSGLG